MVDYTDNHNLQIFSDGSTDWEHRSDFQYIEELLTLRASEVEREEYTPHEGAKFEAVDTEAVFIGNGERWVPVESSGRSPVFDSFHAAGADIDTIDTDELSIDNQPALPAADSPHISIGPPEPKGDYHNTSVGPVVVPHETVHLDKTRINADRDGTLEFGVYEWTSGSGYSEETQTETLTFEVTAGENEITLDLVLDEPDGFDGYVFPIETDVELYRESNRTVDTDFLSIPYGGSSDGRTFDNYYYLFDLKVSASTVLSGSRQDNGGLDMSPYSSTTSRFPVVNPDNFGAKGDGETDDSQAIQDAINAIPDGEQGTLEFSGGKRYRVSSTVSVDFEMIRAVRGNGAWLITDSDIVVLDCHGSNTGVSNPTTGNVPRNIDVEHNPIISGLNIYCNGPSTDADDNTEYLGTGLRVSDIFGLVVRDCYLFNLRHGIETTGKCRNLIYANNHVYDCYGTALLFSAGLDLHQINLTSNILMRCHKLIEFTRGTELDDLTATGNNMETGANSTGRAPANGIHVVAEPSDDTTISNTAFHRKPKFVGNHIESHQELTGPMFLFEEKGHSINWVKITDNLIKADTNGAIKFDRTDSPEPGFDRLHNLSITNNDFRDPEGFAISITGLARQVTVTDNQFSDDVTDNRAVFFEWNGSESQLDLLKLTGNTVYLNDHPKAINIDCNAESVQSFDISDNTFKQETDQSGSTDEDEYVVDLYNVNNLWEIHLTGNLLRCGNAEGYRIQAADPSGLGIIKDNTCRVTNTTAYDLPDSFEIDDSFVVADNVG